MAGISGEYYMNKKEEALEVEGTVTQALANTRFRVQLDNGAEVFSWLGGGTTPFRGEKNDNWDGGFRVPMMIRSNGPGMNPSAMHCGI